MAFLIILNVADILTTYVIIEYGGEEMNPIVIFFMNMMGPLIGMIFLKTFFLSFLLILLLWIKKEKEINFYNYLLSFANGYYAAIVYLINMANLVALTQ